MNTAIRFIISATSVALGALLISTSAHSAVVFNSCPYTLVAQAGDGWSSSSPYTLTRNWVNVPVTTLIMDENPDDLVQSGTIAVQTSSGGPYTNPIAYSTTTSSNGGLLFSLGPAATYGVQIVANGTVPPMGRSIWRVGNAEYLQDDPGVNQALTATAFGTGSGPGGVNDGSVAHGDRWRADTGATENYVGLTFAKPITAEALRVTTGFTNGGGFRWGNYHLQLQYTTGGPWDDVGAASQSSPFYWIDLGNTVVTGIRLYGSDALGNNPTASGGLIVDEIMAFGELVIPEPSIALLLCLGGLLVWSRHLRGI